MIKEQNVPQEYKITKVSEQPPREWNGPNGTVYYIKAMLEGHEKPVSIGKKAPDALKPGDTVYGTVLIEQSFPEDKFKAEKNPNYQGGGGASSAGQVARREYLDHHEDIKAQWAIGQAVQLLKDTFKTDKAPSSQAIELWADTFYAMAERVKTGVRPQDAPKTVVPEPISEDDEDMKSLARGLEADDINIDDIPF